MHDVTRPLVIAHRGASADAPENTIAAFELALEQGADGIELDVHLSADGHPVVIHDFTLERTTNGSGPVSAQRVRDLKRLDAGGWRERRFLGQRVQTLQEVLERFRDRARFWIELKAGSRVYPGIEERMAAVIGANQYEESTIVQSFDMGSLERLRQINPRLRMAALYTAAAPLRGEPPPGVTVLGPPWEVIASEPSLVRRSSDTFGRSMREYVST